MLWAEKVLLKVLSSFFWRDSSDYIAVFIDDGSSIKKFGCNNRAYYFIVLFFLRQGIFDNFTLTFISFFWMFFDSFVLIDFTRCFIVSINFLKKYEYKILIYYFTVISISSSGSTAFIIFSFFGLSRRLLYLNQSRIDRTLRPRILASKL